MLEVKMDSAIIYKAVTLIQIFGPPLTKQGTIESDMSREERRLFESKSTKKYRKMII